jgi:hypothetical protein
LEPQLIQTLVCAINAIKPPGDTVIFVRTYFGITPNILLTQNIPLVCLQAIACPPSARFGRLGFWTSFSANIADIRTFCTQFLQTKS